MNASVKGLLNGFTVYWDEVKGAVKYHLHLLVGEKQKKTKKSGGKVTVLEETMEYVEIGSAEVQKGTYYYSFMNLAKIDQEEANGEETGADTGRNYYVLVEAEGKNKNIISTSQRMLAQVYVLKNGSYSLKN